MRYTRTFESAVLKEVLKIPFGSTRTYKWIARKIKYPKAYRAVGSVLRKNPFPLLIPCHRVVKSGGDAGEYSLGLRLKKELLFLEQHIKKELRQGKRLSSGEKKFKNSFTGAGIRSGKKKTKREGSYAV